MGEGGGQGRREMERQRAACDPYIDGTAARVLQSALGVGHRRLWGNA